MNKEDVKVVDEGIGKKRGRGTRLGDLQGRFFAVDCFEI